MKTYIVKDGETLVVFDCERRREVNQAGMTTGYTREDGSINTDHYTRSPTVLTLEVVQSDNPIEAEAREGRSDELRDILDALLSTGDVVDVVTRDGVFENYVLTNAPYSRTWSDFGSFQPTITFQQVKFASSATAVLSEIAAREEPRRSRGRRNSKDASKQTVDDTADSTERGRVQPEEQRGSSVIFNIARSFRG